VLAYVVGYTIIADKGYQATDEVAGTTTTKVKGSGSIGNASTLMALDSMDLVIPATEVGALFLTTAITSTPNQAQSVCDGNDDAAVCTSGDSTNCTAEYFSSKSLGLYTGDCGSNGRCELFTWCPLEDDSIYEIVQNVGNFTIFVEVDVSFDQFNVQRTNTYDVLGNGRPLDGYNLFTLNEMLQMATGGAISDYTEVASTGAILLVSSVWNCDLDKNIDQCNPEYGIERIDGVEGTISSGFNFRSVTYDVTKTHRLLEKYHGVRIIFICEGVAGKFDLAALSVTLGAGLAYLGIAKLITDYILEYLMPQKDTYAEYKYHHIEDGDDEQAMPLQTNLRG